MSDLTEHMVERMRVEIAQSAADDLLTAVNRLPECQARREAQDHIHQARALVTRSAEHRDQGVYGWIVHVQGVKGVTHVVIRNAHGSVGDSLTARDRALDALLDRGRIPSTTNVITETEEIRPGDICEYSPDEPVVYL